MSKARLVITAVTVERRPVLGLYAAGPLRRGGRGGVRAAVAAAEELPAGAAGGHCRLDHRPAEGAGWAGPGRRATEDRLAPGTPPSHPGSTRHDQPVPDPGRAGGPRAVQAPQVVVYPVRS